MSNLNGMSIQDINGYKKTTIQILEKQIKILGQLDEILKKETDQYQSGDKKEGILTLKKSQDFKEILRNEITKLINFDVVLAVVGTMKAGKSTTINAIVGREILPNRNRPMTALPTLICHNPAQQSPKISLNPTVLNNFLDDLRAQSAILEELLSSDNGMHEDMKNLITFIKSGKKFNSAYDSEENIFEFLYQLNDLVRLSKMVSEIQEDKSIDDDKILQFPFDEYKNFENLPRIDVAFKLDGDFETQGRFMLLDTAGPNEAGQDELKEALAQQLERSSAVMIVLDYTQLNSDAEKDVKEQIDKIPTVQKSRLFALVNKFDQKNANSDDADSTCEHIFKNLLKDKIEFENIYAISAQDAYLVNRFQDCISKNNERPSFEPKSWVEDIATKMFGNGDDVADDYDDASMEKIQKKLDSMIKKSRMQEPMQNVIGNMQKNAPLIAMQSALAGASQVFNDLHNLLEVKGFFAQRENLSAEEIARLDAVMDGLKQQVQDLDNKKSKLVADFEKIKEDINNRINLSDKIKIINYQTKDEISKMFDTESADAKKQLDELIKITKGVTGILNKLILKTEEEVAQEKAKLDELKEKAKSNGNNLIFSSQEDLDKFQEQATKAINKFVQDTVVTAFDEVLQESIHLAKEATTQINQQSEELLKELKHDFSKEGIDLRIDFDAFGNLNKQNAKIGDIKINAKETPYLETRKQSGVIGGIKRGFGGLFKKDWGTYTVNYSTFTISKTETIKQFTDSVSSEFVQPLQKQVEEKVQILLDESTAYIEVFGQRIDEIINEMKQGIEYEKRTVNESKEEKEEYKQFILSIKKSHEELKPNWEKVADKFKVEEVTVSA